MTSDVITRIGPQIFPQAPLTLRSDSRALGPGFGTADWGFAIASEFWGPGIFTEAAEFVLEFAFDVLRTHRLEARAASVMAAAMGR